MIDISALVYSRLVSNGSMKNCLNGSGTTRNDVPPAFPYLYLRTLGQATSASDLQNHQKAIMADFEITIYTIDSSSRCRQLINLAGDIMMGMGFRLMSGPYEVENTAGTGVYRWIARFSRTFADGDTI